MVKIMKRGSDKSVPDVSHSCCLAAKKQFMEPFDVLPVSRFDRKFPDFRLPSELGSFSLDASRNYVHSRSHLRVYSPPSDSNIAWDLSNGYSTFIQRDETKLEYIDHLLEWILTYRRSKCPSFSSDTDDADTSVFADFVCWRGLMTKLLCTPYERLEGWKIAICRFQRTLYMCEFDTDEKQQNRLFDDERQQKMSYWGFKFETYITSADVNSRPEPELPVNNNQAFVSVVRTRLHSHSLVFGGEVDCCERNNNSKYIELKTSRIVESAKQDNNFKRYKLLKWWAQSFLIGISKIVCGFRDDVGIVHRIHEFHTLELPKQSRDIPHSWNASVCFNFCDQFLQYIKDTVQLDYDKAVYVFSWSPGQQVLCEVMDASSSAFSFLPSWYTGNTTLCRADELPTDSR